MNITGTKSTHLGELRFQTNTQHLDGLTILSTVDEDRDNEEQSSVCSTASKWSGFDGLLIRSKRATKPWHHHHHITIDLRRRSCKGRRVQSNSGEEGKEVKVGHVGIGTWKGAH